MAIAKLSIDLEARLANYESDMKRVVALSEQSASKIEGAFKGVTLLFTGLAGALSVGAIKNVFDKYVEGAAALDDFGEIVGSTTEKVSGLSAVAKISGTDLGLLQGGMVKLANSMTTAGDATSKTGAAFKALNLDPRELKLLDTSDAFKAVADRLGEFEDGSTKTALAVALLGKSGAQLLPYMKDLAQTGDLVAKVTTEQGQAAEDYEKNLKRLAAAQGVVAKVIAAEVLPVANEFVKTLVQTISKTDGVKDGVKSLASDGSIKSWAEGAAKAAGFVIDSFDGVQRIVRLVGISLGAAAAQANQLVQGNLAGYKEIGTQWRKDVAEIIDKPMFSESLNKNLESLKNGSSATAPRKKLNFSGGEDGSAGSASKEADAAETLIKTLDKQISVRALDMVTTEKLTAAEKEAAQVKQQIDSGVLKATASQRLLIEGKLEFLVAADKEIQKQNEYNAALESSSQAMLSHRQKMIESIATAENQAEVYGLSESQLSVVTQSRLTDAIAMARANGASEETIQHLREELKLRDQLTDALVKVDQKRIEQQGAAADKTNEFAQQAARNIQSSLADFLFDPFANGADKMAQKFGQVIQRMAADAAAAQIGKALFGDMGSSKGGSDTGLVGAAGNWLSSINWAGLFAANGHAFAGNGPVTAFAGGGAFGNGSVLTRATPFRFADGGTFKSGIAGEAGPEGAMPLKRMRNGKLGVFSEGHQTANNINIHVNSTTGDPAEIRRSAAAGARSALGFMGGARRYA